LASPVGGAPGDEAAGEVEHGEVGVGAFLPADEDATEAVQPGVGALDDPAAGTEARLALDRLRLVAAAADVRGERELRREFAHLVVVVAAVEAQSLRPLPCRLRALDRDRLDRGAAELEVVQVRARRRDPERDALTLGEERSFRPFFALSVGFGPVSSPPSGALPSAPSIANHSHSIPTRLS
jgi:hypothetical protein